MRIAHPRTSAALLLAGLLALSGCSTDPGPEQLKKAEERYQELINQNLAAQDPAWAEVAAQFEAVPKDSKARPEADKRLAALKAAQEKVPPRPLARPGATGQGASDVEAKRAACESLAKKMGEAHTDATRNMLRKVLENCQADLVKLEAHDHPPGEEVHPADEGAR
ncbi:MULTISPECIES: DUF3987 domain-containing protein [unclassified Corallococcus]|uniref:DUF3987 domain-containing protein n=1 Tax=Corallococcus TaxID=83461 RepID=UPI001CBBCB7D|nr:MULTISPECIES: DUF3987 domain-containing protein [unclassified Corallococcus]MBZ4336396.1 DUF3987 domain-containing protein [Corallococcus sp. AS-1-12]MBZ4375845.1 DUF3987 domain-containing protein [Corallococcus sp. AS-1-6]